MRVTKHRQLNHRPYIYAGGALLCLAMLCMALVAASSPSLAQTESNGLVKQTSPACSPNWAIVPSVDPGAQYNWLYGVAADGPNDVWAVGYSDAGGSFQTLIEHWNGTNWTVSASPSPGTTSNSLHAVTVAGPNDVWAVGSYKTTTTGSAQTLIEHWNGTSWTVSASPNPDVYNLLEGVTVVGSNNVWAVGISSASPYGGYHSLIEHWDGTSWTVSASPNSGTNNYLWSISATGPNDIWAVGYENSGSTQLSLIEHWDGTNWTIITSPNPDSTAQLYGVAAVAPNDVWAVGTYGSTLPLIERWNGTSWNVVTSPNPGGSGTLYGVAVAAANDVWAVGNYSGSHSIEPLIERWNGTSWNTVTSADPGSQLNYFYSVTVAGPSDVWAVGEHSDASTANHSLTERYNPCGGGPTSTPRPTETPSGPTSTPTATIIPGSYEDVQPNSPFYSYVTTLTSHGAVGGYACGGAGEPCDQNHDPYYRPGANVTRGQLSKIIALAAGLNSTIPPTQQTFHDVPPSDTFHLYIEQLAQTGAIAGYPCNSPTLPCDSANRPWFLPGNNATRGQISKIVSIAAGFSESIPASQQSFTDVPHSSAFWLYIERLSARGIIGGYNDAGHCTASGAPCFLPNANTTRGQMAKIAANAFFPNGLARLR